MRRVARLAALLVAATACGETPEPVEPTAPAPEIARTQPRPGPTPRALQLVRASRDADDGDAAIALARAALVESDAPACRTRLLEALAMAPGEAPFREHQETVTAAEFTPDGAGVITASRDGTVRTWTLSGQPRELLGRHAAAVHVLRFLPPGDRVLTASASTTAAIFGLAGGERVLRGHTGRVIDAEASADGSRVLTVGLDHTARLWDADGRGLQSFGSPAEGLRTARLAPDGLHVATVSERLVARLWTAEGTKVATLREGAESVERVAYSPDGALVLTDAPDGTLRLWTTAGHLHARLEGHTAPVLDTAFSADGSLLASGSLDSTARIWSVADGTAQAELRGHSGAIFDVVLTADGARVLTVSSDSTARLWDTGGQADAVATLGGPDHPVALAEFAPDGEQILTASRDHGTARLWDRHGRLLTLLRGHGRRILSARFSPDGDHVLTVSSDLTVRVWPTSATALIADANGVGPDVLLPTRADGPVEPIALEDGDGPGTRPDQPARGDYADPAECAPCHRAEYDLWAASAHARTFEAATPANMPADVTGGRRIEHPPGSTQFGNDEEGRLTAETIGSDGSPHPFALTHVVGRQRIRMFVTTLDDGRMQVLPGMLEAPTGRWFDYTHLLFGGRGGDYGKPPVVAPGDASFWTGSGRSWTARCARCHSSGQESRHPGLDGRGARTGWRSLGVDCDACHGPGRDHAEAWRRMETRSPLTKLETLPLSDKTMNCTACHMEGNVVQAGFRPGEDLYEYLDPTLLLSPERADATGRPLELIYDGLPFESSTCAQAGGLTCARCHDAHGSDNPSLLRQPRSQELCLPCHEDLVGNVAAHAHHDAANSGGSCLACHMPSLTVERGHGAVVDHTLGVPYLDIESDRMATDACTWCHTGGLGAPEGVDRLTPEALRTAYAKWWPEAAGPRPWMRALAAARAGRGDAGPALVDVAQDDANPRVVRASAAWLLERYAKDHKADLLGLADDPDTLVRRSGVGALGALRGEDIDARLLAALSDPSFAVRRVAAEASLAGWRRVRENRDLLDAVIPVLEADVEAVPDDYRRWFRLGAARGIAGDTAGALDAYEHQLAIDPFARAVRRHVEKLRKRLAGEGE